MNSTVVLTTDFPTLKFLSRGKVRDIYDVGDALLLVSTDRLSAFDVVMAEGIPFKGAVLNRLSEFWFAQIADIVPHHMLTTRVEDFPAACRPYADVLRGRSMLVKKARPLPLECIVRGYLSGSGWKDYQRTGSVCGMRLPAGLGESAILPEPVFTPSTKAEAGAHDENIDFAGACDLLGRAMAEQIRDLSISIYLKARSLAEARGIIIADTKMEFGTLDGQIILIDELLTPDSSRFWPQQSYAPGGPQMSFDKQFVRDYLESLNWSKTPPPPHLPEDIIAKTSQRYIDAFAWLTGKQISA